MFLWGVTLNAFTVSGSSIYFFTRFTIAQVFFSHPVLLGLTIFTTVISWTLAGMTGYHSWLVSRNLTTHEEVIEIH
jgi:hypothetical protein